MTKIKEETIFLTYKLENPINNKKELVSEHFIIVNNLNNNDKKHKYFIYGSRHVGDIYNTKLGKFVLKEFKKGVKDARIFS